MYVLVVWVCAMSYVVECTYCVVVVVVFFFNDTATTEIYTLSLHDALPISFFFTGTVGE